MKYFVDDERVTKEDFSSRLEEAVYDEAANKLFDKYLDSNEDIDILGINYSVSYVLRNTDPTRYKCMLADFTDSILGDAACELEMNSKCTYNEINFKIEEN